jgi:RNA polymerase II subunit A-like phosphatase
MAQWSSFRALSHSVWTFTRKKLGTLSLQSTLTHSRSDYALWIRSFGADVATSINRRTTHVIANPDRKTTKVKQAARYPHIKIVNPEWMFQCCTRWEHVEETPYTIEIDPAERGGSPFGELEDESINATGDEEPDEAAESPVTLDLTADNWRSVDDELADFLNDSETDEDHNESDSDSIRSDNSTALDAKQSKKKRKRSTNSTDASEAEESDGSIKSASKLQRRKKRTMDRSTSLTNVVTVDKSSGLPSPETTGPEEDHGDDGDKTKKGPEVNRVALDPEQDDEDSLEAELLAGFGDSDDDP